VGALVQKSEAELMDIRNFGQKSIDEVKAKLEELGLGLREEECPSPRRDRAWAPARHTSG